MFRMLLARRLSLLFGIGFFLGGGLNFVQGLLGFVRNCMEFFFGGGGGEG